MSKEKSQSEELQPFIVGDNEDPDRNHRQYDLHAPDGYLEYARASVHHEAGTTLSDHGNSTAILNLGFPNDCKSQSAYTGAIAFNKTGPKLVHVTRDDLGIDKKPLRPADGSLYLHACTDEGYIRSAHKKKDWEEARKPISLATKRRDILKIQAAKDIAELVVQDLIQQIELHRNTAWLFNNNELFPIRIPEKWQQQIGFEPYGRTLCEVIPEEPIGTGLNVIQREGLLKRLAWIDDLFNKAKELINGFLSENLGTLLGNLPQRQQLASQHGIGVNDIPIASVSFATPPLVENGDLNIYYLPRVGVLSRNQFEKALSIYRTNVKEQIEKFLKLKCPKSKVEEVTI